MIIENDKTKSIRMGWKNSFVKGVILSDGTLLSNMQYNSNAKIPTDEELKKIDEQNRNLKENDIFNEFEKKACELEEITDMLGLIYEDYYTIQDKDLYTKANNYDRLEKYLINIHSLLFSRQKEMEKIIDDVYEEKRGR